jgi:hypothetical protein
MPPRQPKPEGENVLLQQLVQSLADLGEIKGQLRELIHTGNSNSTKLDALGIRVAALETERSRREGAAGLVQMILKSPLIAWLAAIAATLWAVATGKLHP